MSEQIPQCEQCQQRYNLFRRKKQCHLCGQTFCSKCISKVTGAISSNNSRACTICLIIINERTTREQLSSIRIKHLRAYLIHSKTISSNRLESCLEKQDLINIIESKKRPTIDDTYIFVERSNVTRNIPTSNDHTTIITDNNNQQDVQQPNLNTNQQTSSSSNIDSSIPSNETRTEPINPPTSKINLPRITLNKLSSIESIHDLTIRQLKDILVQNFVSTTGCVEKSELINKVELLYRDHQQNESNINGASEKSDENLCKICMDAPMDCVFLDCGHLCTCVQCGKRLSECPLCRSFIIRVVRVFKS